MSPPERPPVAEIQDRVEIAVLRRSIDQAPNREARRRAQRALVIAVRRAERGRA